MKGQLKLAANKKTWLLVREDGKEMQVPAKALAKNLFPLDAQKHDGLAVEYELDKGQPAKIYEAGAAWQPQGATVPAQSQPRPPQQAGGKPYSSGKPSTSVHQERASSERQQFPRTLPGDFHNPYNFIPALPRNNRELGELGDRPPSGHGSYGEKLWSGRITVTLTTHSPLLIFDAGRAELYRNDKKLDHKVFPMRLDSNNQPYLPPTSIKGMLRAAYEAITNSRLAIFDHPDRLAYRMAAKIGPVPARVEKRNGKDVLRILQANVIGFAAKLPRYEERSRDKDKGKERMALRYPDRTFPEHGDAVWVQLNNARVSRIEQRTDDTPPAAGWTKGWVCVTGPNINKKRYERVFLEVGEHFIPLEDKHRDLWRELIQNYQETHERDLKQRRLREESPSAYLGDQPGKTGWSRHIYEKRERELRQGTLCYVEFVANSTREIAALIPVTISRRLYSSSPDDLLPHSLKPAQNPDQLSPAERVFGWVNQNGNGAYRGNVRIGPVSCLSPDAVWSCEKHNLPPLPLAILGQPKPQQARFYVAQSKQGEAQPNGTFKEQAGYLLSKGLRGRKVYPHHAGLPDNHWVNPHEDRTQQSQNGHFQEYRRPHKPELEYGRAKLNQERTGFKLQTGDGAEQRDDQNRSIKGWVKPQSTFEFGVEVSNLSDVELGALLWLLALPEGHFHRLGGGKPLGFGSVRLTVAWEKTDLRQGEAWRDYYSALEETGQPSNDAAQGCVKKFETAVAIAYGNGDLNRVSFLNAFKRSARGFADGLPIHYPRALQDGQHRNSTIPPHPEGKAFEWFVANERTGKQGGPKLALPDLEHDEGLPILQQR